MNTETPAWVTAALDRADEEAARAALRAPEALPAVSPAPRASEAATAAPVASWASEAAATLLGCGMIAIWFLLALP